MFRCKQTLIFIERQLHISSSVMAGNKQPSMIPTVCQRLGAINGDYGKQNDVIVCGSVKTAKQHVLFFGGDVQDYQENMVKFNSQYKEWDLETSGQLIQSQFADSAVFVIKPTYMYLNTFSIYKNFLDFDGEGKPCFSTEPDAFTHLKQLYYNAIDKATESANDRDDTKENYEQNIDKSVPIKLVGFSKGCVVLNQLVFGLNSAMKIGMLKQFLDQIVALYWLDGGHAGGRNGYITDEGNLRILANWNKDIFVNVTPYQIKDPMRKWIGREEKEFVSKLKQEGHEAL